MIVIITNRTLVEEECDSGMVDKLLNKCNRVTGVIRCFHYANIGHYLKLMAGWGTGEGVVGGYMHVSQIYIC